MEISVTISTMTFKIEPEDLNFATLDDEELEDHFQDCVMDLVGQNEFEIEVDPSDSEKMRIAYLSHRYDNLDL